MAELKAKIGIDTTELQKGLDRAESEITGFLKKVDNIASIGQKLQSIGKSLTVGLTLPIAGLATASLNAFKEIEGVRTAFERLNDPNLLNELRKATKNTTTDLQLMQSAVSAEKFGLSTSALPKLLEYARRVAKDTGQSVDYLVDSIVTGIGRKSPLILDNLGISATALKEALGGVSMEAASVGQVTEAVAKIATAEVEKMGAETLTLAESWAQVRTSVSNSLGRIGEIINKNFDISGIISKVTDFINRAMTAFENLNPAVQKSILVIAGLTAAAGPLIVAVGTFMAALPTLIKGLGALKLAFTSLVSPIGLATSLLVALGIGFVVFSQNTRDATDRNREWSRSLAQSHAEADTQVAKLRTLYQATQNTSLSIEERTKKVKELQKIYPEEFGNLDTQIILNGKAESSYYNLAQSIYATARAKAAEKHVQKIAEESLNKEIELRKRLNKEIQNYKNPKEFNYTYGTAGSGIKEGTVSADEIKKRSAEIIFKIVKQLKANNKATDAELKFFEDIIGKGTKKAVETLDTNTANIAPVLKKNLGEAKKVLSDEFKGLLPLKALPSASTFEIPGISDIVNEENAKRAFAIQNFIKNTEDERKAYDDWISSIEDTEKRIFESGILDFGASIGEALINGTSALRAGASAILSMLSAFTMEFAKRVAEMAVTAGVLGKLLVAIKNSIKNPFVLIAIAATAAVVAGALASQAKKVASTGTGGGSYGGGGTFTPDTGVRSYSSSYGATSTGSGEVVFRISGPDLVGVLERNQSRNDRLT